MTFSIQTRAWNIWFTFAFKWCKEMNWRDLLNHFHFASQSGFMLAPIREHFKTFHTYFRLLQKTPSGNKRKELERKLFLKIITDNQSSKCEELDNILFLYGLTHLAPPKRILWSLLHYLILNDEETKAQGGLAKLGNYWKGAAGLHLNLATPESTVPTLLSQQWNRRGNGSTHKVQCRPRNNTVISTGGILHKEKLTW